MSDAINSPPTLESLRARRDEIIALAEKHGVSNVRVVGSVARGEGAGDSDVDLLINTPSKYSVFDLVGLWIDLEELLGCSVSVIPDSADDVTFMQSILEDAVPL